MFCDSYILTLNELELSLEIDDIPLETELDSPDDEIGLELSLETELSELNELSAEETEEEDSVELAVDELVSDELDDSDDEDWDDVVVAVKPSSAADELSALDELASELDELLETELADDAPNTALNCSSVTQVSPTQILFALTAPFSNDIPNIVLNLSKIQANKLSVPVPLEAAALACKSLTFKFISCIALIATLIIALSSMPVISPFSLCVANLSSINAVSSAMKPYLVLPSP